MKLYDIPKGAKMRLPIGKDSGSAVMTKCKFHHLDGMYSYITVEEGDDKGAVVHLGGGCPVKKVDDHYEIKS